MNLAFLFCLDLDSQCLTDKENTVKEETSTCNQSELVTTNEVNKESTNRGSHWQKMYYLSML